MLKTKLNVKFCIVTVLLLSIVALAWYGIYFIKTNEVMTEDGPMGDGTRSLIAALLSVVALSWTASLLTMIRQIVLGSGFVMDENGIHDTATAVMIFSFIFVVPVKCIPYDAILSFEEINGIPTARLDKSRLTVLPFFRPFVRGEYHFFSGFTKDCSRDVIAAVKRYAHK